MRKAAGLRIKNILVHLGIWIGYILFELSIALLNNPGNIIWSDVLFAFMLNAGIFYAWGEFMLPWCGRQRSYVFAVPGFLLLIVVYLLLRYGEDAFILLFIRTKSGVAHFTKDTVSAYAYRGILFMIFGTGYWFAKKSVASERKLRKADEEKFLRELHEKEQAKELAITQMRFIRSQINPHFLYNTLNFFYSNLLDLSKPLARAMMIFSDIMRYTIGQDTLEGMTDLSYEIKHIENYIELNQLRFHHVLCLKFEVKGSAENKRIAAFVLMTLIENAFKYGDMTDPSLPTVIELNITDKQIDFYMENKIKENAPLLSGDGIGLHHIRKILDLIYGRNYNVQTKESGQKFQCSLQIPIAYDQVYNNR
ncbi:MAG: sensor histidine kinase [Mucilaginibacter sp.]|uniref:sensor histidine kinase n=1 Tax=Mucilaginibacter sp. TaxID=1882438 RepID=UPI0032651F8F